MPPRIRYTHKMVIYRNDNTIYAGVVSGAMTPLHVTGNQQFRIAASTNHTDDLVAIIATGVCGDDHVTEQIVIPPGEFVYSDSTFTDITSLISKSYDEGASVTLSAVDDAYQPVMRQIKYGPYGCIFSTNDGISAGIRHSETGISAEPSHYVRVTYRAPVSRDMMFTVTPGYEGKIFVPISDFDVVRMPPTSRPVEWAFRAARKED